MMRFFLSVILVSGPIVTSGCDRNQPSPTDPRPNAKVAEWTPDAAVLTQLADATDVPGNPGWTIRPPKGYISQSAPPGLPAEAMGIAWVSPARADATHGQLILSIIKLPSQEPNKYTAEQLLAKRLTAI